jgi:hypothetical protein
VKFVTGQKSYVDKIIHQRQLNDNHKIIIKPFYNANGVDLRQNVFEEFEKRRNDRLKEINDENAKQDKAFNKALKKEIKIYNIDHPNKKRMYPDEKRVTPKVKKSDIPVKFSKLSFVYTINKYVGFNEVLQIILDINKITQDSPMTSDED